MWQNACTFQKASPCSLHAYSFSSSSDSVCSSTFAMPLSQIRIGLRMLCERMSSMNVSFFSDLSRPGVISCRMAFSTCFVALLVVPKPASVFRQSTVAFTMARSVSLEITRHRLISKK